MEVTLLYFDDCPNWQDADTHLRTLQDEIPDLKVTRRVVDTPEEAERTRFRGSPSILIDGIDPFADADAPVGLSCRMYRTPDGPAGSPTFDQLRQLLRAHHGKPLPEITVRYAQTARPLATPELIENLLDTIHQTTSEPVLVRLETKDASLSLGLGRTDLSIALYLDTDNTPWHALGDPNLSPTQPITFASPNHQHEYNFYAEAAVTVETARAAARAFLLQPSEQPATVTWIPEDDPNRETD